MRKVMVLGVLVLACGVARAQDPPPQQEPQRTAATNPALKPGHPLDPNDVNVLTGRATMPGEPTARPKPGHPLDPADVDILTGKADGGANGSRLYGTPYGYYTYMIDPLAYRGESFFGSTGRSGGMFFTPRVFGRVGGRSFVVLSLGSRGRGTTVVLAPGGGRGMRPRR